MACGRPVIAFNRGGARETVISDAVGLKFDIQSGDSLVTAVRRFETVEHTFDRLAIRKHAEKFNKSVFQARLRALIDREMAAKAEVPAQRKRHSRATVNLSTWSRPKGELRPRASGE